jgi:hypothetical protein
MTKPEGRHVNKCAVVGLECQAQVELQDTISPKQRPITSTGQHLPAKPRARVP